MPSVRSKSEATEKHVPAWKKLGLKLKYAKDEPEAENNGSQPTFQNEKKRKHVFDETIPSTKPYPKKLKANSLSSFTSIESTAITTTPPRDFSNLKKPSLSPPTSNAPTTPTGPGLKRKSVTFTPETKIEDGDSIKQLYNTWLASHRAVDPAFDPSDTTNSPALKIAHPPSITFRSSPSHPVLSEQKPKAKKKKKSKSKSTLLNRKSGSQPSQTKKQASPTSTAKDDQIRTYVTTHHLSPSAWKFSKSRQNALLRSVFSLSTLPLSYDLALLSYLRGLQGAAAKSRVRKMALQTRAEDEEWLEGLEPSEKDKARRRAEYNGAVERVREMLKRKEELREEQLADEEWATKFRKRRRAEVVLWGVGEVEDITPHPLYMSKDIEKAKDRDGGNGGTANVNRITTAPTVRTSTNLARNGKPKRKRKVKSRKTGMPDDDETSSSSSSSSGSSSSSEDDEDGRTGVGRIPQRAIWDEETSSEESSSTASSSTEDSEDDSEDASGSASTSGDGSDSSDSGTVSQSGSDESG